MQLFTDIVWGMFGSPAYTTPNPSREEIEAAMILTAVRSDALDFFEFVDDFFFKFSFNFSMKFIENQIFQNFQFFRKMCKTLFALLTQL